ncbi:MAG TPA: glycosyltransferase 87 family protein [Planctomycetota bacterium]
MRYITPERVNGLLLLLCAMALGSVLVETPGGNGAALFWLIRALAVSLAAVALFVPRLQSWALVAAVVGLVLAPAAFQMWARSHEKDSTKFCHDSVIQFEEAARMLRQGRNPYAENFRGTPLDGWRGFFGDANPAVHHFVYPPLLLLVSTPFEAAGRAAGFYDQRILILLLFGGFVALLLRDLQGHPHAVGLVSIIALNPFLAPYVVEGRNDVGMLLGVAAAGAAYARGRTSWGDLWVGVAIAAKTLLLPILPFLLWARRKELGPAAARSIGPLALTCLPFFAWGPGAFVEDVFLAPAGLGSHPFEMRGWGGYGFANLILVLGADPKARFPFGIFQLLALIPCLRYGLRSLDQDPGWPNVLRWTVVTAFALLFFGRFIHDNYIGALLSMAGMAALWRDRDTLEPSSA